MIGLATKKDFFLVSIIGVLFGSLVIPVLQNIRPAFWQLNFTNAAATIIGFLIFANVAMAIAGLIGKKFPSLFQFAKFSASGSLNAALDIGLFNLLSYIFQVFSGPLLALFNGIVVFIAFNNSYFWNKLWVFKADGTINIYEYLKFAAATLVGLILGTSIVYYITTFVSAPTGISPQIWENVAKAISIPLVVASNFSLYKFVVFKK
jgi:putative flippase GtrA